MCTKRDVDHKVKTRLRCTVLCCLYETREYVYMTYKTVKAQCTYTNTLADTHVRAHKQDHSDVMQRDISVDTRVSLRSDVRVRVWGIEHTYVPLNIYT